jgi:hypothetical protein
MSKYSVSIVVAIDGYVDIHVLRTFNTIEECRECMVTAIHTARNLHFSCPLVWIPDTKEHRDYNLYCVPLCDGIAEVLSDACGSAMIREVNNDNLEDQ